MSEIAKDTPGKLFKYAVRKMEPGWKCTLHKTYVSTILCC